MPDDTMHDPRGDDASGHDAGETGSAGAEGPSTSSVITSSDGPVDDSTSDTESNAVTDTDTDSAARGRTGRWMRIPMNRAWVAAIVAAAVVLAAAGIALGVTSGGNKDKAATPAIHLPIPGAPSGPPCPLTGVPTATQVPQRPALAIKIDNYPQARPQSGLDKADIVFEEPVEGGITRLVAVFQCQSPALAGPIRSARAVDVQILDQLSRPLFLHVGGINPVINMLRNGNLTDENLFYNGSVTQHPPGRYAPYDTYVSGSAAWSLATSDTTPPAPVFSYSGITPAGTAVTGVHIPFSSTNDVHWAWDAPSGHWLLSWGSSPAMVANGGQIFATNVVVQTVHVTYGPWLENDVGGLEVQSQMIGSGPLTVLRNGIAVTGTWQRASSSSITSLLSSSGAPIALAPGPTWVEIVPSTVTVTTTAPPPASSAAHSSTAAHAP